MRTIQQTLSQCTNKELKDMLARFNNTLKTNPSNKMYIKCYKLSIENEMQLRKKLHIFNNNLITL